MCLSGAPLTALQQAVQSALSAGLLVVASAGNATNCGTGVTYPAKIAGVVAVSGTLEDDTFATAEGSHCNGEASRAGAEVTLSAPFIVNTALVGGTWGVGCGTSNSAPIVSAIAAMVWSRFPGWTASQVRQRLYDTAIDLGPTGWDAQFGYGRVDAYYALYDPAHTITLVISGPDSVRPYATCTWNATATNGTIPYTFAWFANDQDLSFPYQTLQYQAGTGSFALRSEAVDDYGSWTSTLKTVTVSPYASECVYY